MKHILIVGATSGIAQATAHQFASHNWNLILAGRDLPELERISVDLAIRYSISCKVNHFDALNYGSHESFWEESLLLAGGELDGILLCHGYLGDQKKGQTDFQEAQAIIATNFTSCVSLLTIAGSYFERKASGFICALSSVAGDRGRQSNYLSGSSKGALSLFLQGLRNRLNKVGVTVLTVKPGFVDTKMTYGVEGMFLVAKPEAIAKGIYSAILKKKSIVYLPGFWRWIMLIIKLVPEFIFKRLSL